MERRIDERIIEGHEQLFCDSPNVIVTGIALSIQTYKDFLLQSYDMRMVGYQGLPPPASFADSIGDCFNRRSNLLFTTPYGSLNVFVSRAVPDDEIVFLKTDTTLETSGITHFRLGPEIEVVKVVNIGPDAGRKLYFDD